MNLALNSAFHLKTTKNCFHFYHYARTPPIPKAEFLGIHQTIIVLEYLRFLYVFVIALCFSSHFQPISLRFRREVQENNNNKNARVQNLALVSPWQAFLQRLWIVSMVSRMILNRQDKKKLFMRTYDRHTIKGFHHFFRRKYFVCKTKRLMCMIISSRSKFMANIALQSTHCQHIWSHWCALMFRMAAGSWLLDLALALTPLPLPRSFRCCFLLVRPHSISV